MRNTILLLAAVGIAMSAVAQKKLAYQLYTATGKKADYGKMLKQAAASDVVLFGEYHDNPISHWLQLELLQACFEKRKLVLGAEMFEQDNQQQLNDYLQGKLSAKGLDSAARLWKNYKTDYAPLVNFAKDKGIDFAATNVPRRYASMVAKGGFGVLDTLPAVQKAWMAPLPIAYDSTLPGYKKMAETMADHGGPNLPKAQALKDATMAHFMLQHYVAQSLLIHFNGAGHTDNYDGIVWYLKRSRPDLKYLTISTVSQKDISKLAGENKGRADFIICVDSDMTLTY